MFSASSRTFGSLGPFVQLGIQHGRPLEKHQSKGHLTDSWCGFSLRQKSCRKNSKNIQVCPFLEKLHFAVKKTKGVHVVLQSHGKAELTRLGATAGLCGRASWGPTTAVSPSPHILGRPSQQEELGDLLSGSRTWTAGGTADHIKGVITALYSLEYACGSVETHTAVCWRWWTSIMSHIPPWLLLESRGLGVNRESIQPPLCITFLLSHLEWSWSRCKAALAPFQPSCKPELSYFLLCALGRYPFSMSAC